MDDYKKNPRFKGITFKLDGISESELKSLQFNIINNGTGIELGVKTDAQDISKDFVTGYRRDKGDGFNLKQTGRVSNTGITNVIENLDRFDYVLAIDTNSKQINGNWTHVGAVCELVRNLSECQTKINFCVRDITLFVLKTNHVKPENENWKNLIAYFRNDTGYRKEKRVGIVIDSDLGNLEKYNNKEKPIVGAFYLPDNFELIYASADAQNDSVINKAISYCDKQAAEYIKKLLSVN